MPTHMLIGLDVGMVVDYAAVALVKRTAPDVPHPNELPVHDPRRLADLTAIPNAAYEVEHQQRFQLHTPYAEVVHRTCDMVRDLEKAYTVITLVDVTGVGAGIMDHFDREAVRAKRLFCHGGQHSRTSDVVRSQWNVAKLDLVWSIQTLAQARPVRLGLGDELPFAREVRQELGSFQAKYHPLTAHESFASWREQDHDDMVFAIALCTWWGEVQIGGKKRAYMVPYSA